VHNLRASLDHLQAALVPANRNRSAKFQIQRDDIWKRDKQTGAYVKKFETRRQSWLSAMKHIDPKAETFIKSLQPYEQGYVPEFHPIARLNALDDADKHYKLLPVATGIDNPIVTITNGQIRLTYENDYTMLSGAIVARFVIRPPDVARMTDDDAMRELILTTMADGEADMDVELTGTPEIALPVADAVNKQLVLPGGLDNILDVTREVILFLERYVLPHGQTVG